MLDVSWHRTANDTGNALVQFLMKPRLVAVVEVRLVGPVGLKGPRGPLKQEMPWGCFDVFVLSVSA
jgi:hypothetical protein